jgi:hypothetical protein
MGNSLRVYNVFPEEMFFSVVARNFACTRRNVAGSAFKQHREFCYEIAIARLGKPLLELPRF